MYPENMKVGMAQETAVDEKDKKAVEKEEPEIDKDAGRQVFYVDLNADTCGNIADDGLRHAIDADWGIRESVLKQADRSAR